MWVGMFTLFWRGWYRNMGKSDNLDNEPEKTLIRFYLKMGRL